MGLTITEAVQVSTLLRYLLDAPFTSGTPITPAAAREAAAYLADRANAALSAGLNGNQVRSLWAAAPPTPAKRQKARGSR